MYQNEGPCPRIGPSLRQDGGMPQSSTTRLIVNSLHTARFGTYVHAAGGDSDLALRLYVWNLELASAFHTCLGVTEVLLRNAMDTQLRVWNAAQAAPPGAPPYPSEWLVSPARPLHSLTAAARQKAKRNAENARAARPPTHPRKRAAITHDDILAHLSFGTFARLLPTKNTRHSTYRARSMLWSQALVHAFPAAKNDPHGFIVADRVARLHALRNRVAHLEPLLSVNVTARHRDMIRLLGAIDPGLQGWFASLSPLRRVAASRPG